MSTGRASPGSGPSSARSAVLQLVDGVLPYLRRITKSVILQFLVEGGQHVVDGCGRRRLRPVGLDRRAVAAAEVLELQPAELDRAAEDERAHPSHDDGQEDHQQRRGHSTIDRRPGR